MTTIQRTALLYFIGNILCILCGLSLLILAVRHLDSNGSATLAVVNMVLIFINVYLGKINWTIYKKGRP